VSGINSFRNFRQSFSTLIISAAYAAVKTPWVLHPKELKKSITRAGFNLDSAVKEDENSAGTQKHKVF
jgi:hypothetical protein